MKFVEVTSEDILLTPLGYRFFPLGYDQKHLIFAIFKKNLSSYPLGKFNLKTFSL
jgi:hypothetical protein